MTGGATLEDLAWGFANSDEFQDAYGAELTNADFLDILYSNILGRTPDTAGFEYWLGEMDTGLGQDGMVRWITANDEFIGRFPYEGKSDWAAEDILLSRGEEDCNRDLLGVSSLQTTATLDLTTVEPTDQFAVTIIHNDVDDAKDHVRYPAAVRYDSIVTTFNYRPQGSEPSNVAFQKVLGHMQDRADHLYAAGD